MAMASPNKKAKKNQSINLKTQIRKRMFILSWIQNYDIDMMIGDVIAGITLGLIMIPQAIAYAGLAELPTQYGLYSAFMGSIHYTERRTTMNLISDLLKVR